MMEGRFTVVVRYESENKKNQYPQDIYYHNAPYEAARRLASLINGSAKWVPARARVATHKYILDRTDGNKVRLSLEEFRKKYKVTSCSHRLSREREGWLHPKKSSTFRSQDNDRTNNPRNPVVA